MNRSAVSSSAAASPGADAADVVTPIVLKTSVPCPPERAFAYFTRDIARWWPLATYSCGGFEKLGDRALQAKSEYENGWLTVFGRLYPAYCSDAHKGGPLMKSGSASSLVAALAAGACVAGTPGHAVAETFNRDIADLRVVKEAVVAAPPSAVWRAWTEPAVITEFFAPRARVELRPGGAYEMLFLLDAPAGEQGSEGCTVLSYLPERMLTFSWNAPPKFREARGRHTWVVIELEALPDSRTRVRLTHYGFGHGTEWDQVHAYFDRAWGSVMANLAAHFAAAAKPPAS